MPGTRQAGQPVEQRHIRARTIPESQSKIFHDHQGRPFRSIWEGDSAKRPKFSWQVYLTSNVDEDPADVATFLGGLEIAEYEATFDIYAPLPSTYACIAHQKLERQHRKSNPLDQSQFITIPECYDSDLHLGGFIIVVDTPEWKSEGYGPVFATFDVRPATLAVVEPGFDSEDEGIFERIELRLRRQRQPEHVGLDLRTVWMGSGGYDWEKCNAEALEKLSASPEARSIDNSSTNWTSREDLVIQSSDYDSDIRQVQVKSGADKDTANMTYCIYSIFPNAQNSEISLEETARSFTAAIGSQLLSLNPSVSFEFFGPLPDIGSCISHNHNHVPSSTGYLFPGSDKRRYPQHAVEAAAAAHSEEPTYRTFLVVLDKVDWALNDGVLFVWDDLRQDLRLRRNTEALVGRLPGLKTVAGRLAGLL